MWRLDRNTKPRLMGPSPSPTTHHPVGEAWSLWENGFNFKFTTLAFDTNPDVTVPTDSRGVKNASWTPTPTPKRLLQ